MIKLIESLPFKTTVAFLLAIYVFFGIGFFIGNTAHRLDDSNWKRDPIYAEKQFWWPSNRYTLVEPKIGKI